MKKFTLLLAILSLAFSSTYGQKTYTYYNLASEFGVYADGSLLRKVPKTSTEKFGNFDALGNIYTYIPTSYTASVNKNGTYLTALKAGKFGNCFESVCFTWDTLRGIRDTLKLKQYKNGALSQTIAIANNEKYGETDSYGNLYTYIYTTSGVLTVNRNGKAHKYISRMGDFGSVDASGNVFTWLRNSDGSITVNKNGVYYYKTAIASTMLFGDCR
jgi:hypothetical protein